MTAGSLNQLASLLDEMGDRAGARPLLERALAVREKALGPDHPETAKTLHNLALLLQQMGDLNRARQLFDRALAIRERSLGPNHPETATTLCNLGLLLLESGDRAGARPLLERSLAIREKVLGPDHPATAHSLNSLATALRGVGDLRAARPLLERALAACEKALGPNHSNTTKSMNNLADLLQGMGDVEAARPFRERAWKLNREALHLLLPVLSSRERFAILMDRSPQLGSFLAANVDDATKTYEAACAWKGAALRASSASTRLPADASQEARRAANDLAEARGELARLTVSPPMPRAGEPSNAERFDALRTRVEGLERRLAGWLPEFASRAFLDVEVEEVMRTIPEGAVLLDTLENAGTLYAWVVRRGAIATAAMGKSSDFAPLAQEFREALERDDEEAWKKAGAALRARLDVVLKPALDGPDPENVPEGSGGKAKTLYLSPDGVLATIPWALLPEGDGFLIERLPIVSVNGGAAMVMAARSKRGETGDGLLAFGDVDYSGLDRVVPPLPATKAEVEQIAMRFRAHEADSPCRVLTGKEASKAAFVAEAEKARYVHVATHGFFDLEHLAAALGGTTRGLKGGKISAPLEWVSAPKKGIGEWNPLLLSGIVLARSDRGASSAVAASQSDGWLTAEELQGLDLSGVDLVVLSACETGRGELAAGEGVLGLSRALSVAGARGFMLSLWKVPDDETSKLMDGFYQGLWEKSETPEEALRATQLRMLLEDRERKVFRPSTWGAWVLLR